MPVTPKTVLTCALVALVAAAGAAAAQPAAGPNDASTHDARQGPPDDLPGPVPEFVGDVLDVIEEKLSGALSGEELGSALSDLLGGDGGARPG